MSGTRGAAFAKSRQSQAVRVGIPSRREHQGGHRIESLVDGEPLWFESPDVPLQPSMEAFGSALLLAAAAERRHLQLETRPDADWLRNTGKALAIAADWWGYARLAPAAPVESLPPSLSPQAHGTALCFSGGVDSFHALLRGEHRVDHLVFVQGYDMDLSDSVRAAAMEASLRRVAAELRIQPVLVRTNLRAHHATRNADWEKTHGGGLAAIGHLLVDRVNQLLISSSYPRMFDRPWGSHWTLDPCWSSSRLHVQHVGAEKWRAEKLAELVDELLVRQHLRVCWENRLPSGNCGQCEKCLRTMLVLDGLGRLADFPVFTNPAELSHNLGRLDPLRPHLLEIYGRFLELNLSADVRRAVEELMERSRSALRPHFLRSWWRRLRRA